MKKRSMNKLLVNFLFSQLALLISTNIYSQVLQGEWRDHLSFRYGYRIADAGEIIYCASQSGMLSYNKETNEIQKHSKVTGLSDVEVSTIASSAATNKLVIGYLNGNIDLINFEDGTLNNLADIKRKSITGEKSINNIYISEYLAYLSCSFGIVVLDLDKEEIKDSYYFGEGGSQIAVNDVTIIDNFLYAATEYGIYYADLNSPNLVDYNYWDRLDFIPQYASPYTCVENHQNTFFAVYHETVSDEDKIITISNDNYLFWDNEYYEAVNDITSSNGFFSISGDQNGIVYDHNGNMYLNFTSYSTKHIYVDAEQNVYVASLVSGFTNQLDSETTKYFVINSPKFREVSKVESMGDHVWVSSGGPQNLYKHGAAYSFINNKWSSYTGNEIQTTNPLGNTYKFAIDPQDHNHVFAGAYLYGIIEFRDGQVHKIIEKDDLEIFSDIEDVVGLRPTGIQYDQQNNLYILMSFISRPLVILDNEGNWKRPQISNTILNKEGIRYSDLLVTNTGQIWLCTKRDGIIVVEDDGSGNYISNSFLLKNQDLNTISKAYCLDEDNEGDIWVGTNSGPLIYSSPSRFINEDDHGYQVKIPRNDGTNNADFLLFGEAILDIQTDGANRKWMATENSGVFLISEDGRNTLVNFKDDNSPLFSNSVSGIGINEKDGEVFFATNKGLLSYKGSAIKGLSGFTDVYVYPNPVRPDYDGIITITGLVANSIVKITDVSGNLVYETTSLGGQAIWDGKNFNGRRVASGVYLVFLATEDGSQSHLTKLLFLH